MLLLVTAATWWCLTYALEIANPALESKLFWAKIQSLGILSIPPAWSILLTEYRGLPSRVAHPGRLYALLWLIPAVSLFLVWTNELHHLIWREVSPIAQGTYSLLRYDHGPGFWLIAAYGYALLLQGTVWLIGKLLSDRPVNRRLVGIALTAVIVPWTANLLYIAGASAFTPLDWTPIAFVLSGLLLTFSVFRYRVLDLLPVAYRDIFAGLDDAVIVLDLEGRVTDANPAAQALLESPLGAEIAAPGGLLAQIAARPAQGDAGKVIEGDLTSGNEPDARTYGWRATTLASHARPDGHLVTLRDVTQRRLYRVQLEQVRADLEEQCALQTAALEAANRQLQEELVQRGLYEQALGESEQTYRVLFERAGDAILIVEPDGRIHDANRQAVDMLGYTREALRALAFAELAAPGEEIDIHREIARELAVQPRAPEVRFLIRSDGRIIPAEISTALVLDPDGQPRYLQCIAREVAERIRAQLEQSRLIEELQESQEQLRALSNHLQEVQEAERRELAEILHDRVGQSLTGLNLNLRLIERELDSAGDAGARKRLDDALQSVEEITRQVRDVMVDLHPPVLDYGLLATLRWYCQVFSERTGIAVRVVGEEFDPRLAPAVETVLFRMVQEILNNVAKHARASQVIVTAETVAQTARLRVDDNGVGFDPQAPEVPEGHPHWGLMTLAQRAASIDGELAIHSAPGRGTHFTIEPGRGQDAD
jgi:PAS domain S-box-containing protein